MKHQQVVVDYWTMIKTSCTCLLLALSGYVLIKMVQTIFWLPSHLKKNQQRLEDLAAQYKIDLNNLDEEAEHLLNEENLNDITGEDKTSKDKDKEEIKEPEIKKDL